VNCAYLKGVIPGDIAGDGIDLRSYEGKGEKVGGN